MRMQEIKSKFKNVELSKKIAMIRTYAKRVGTKMDQAGKKGHNKRREVDIRSMDGPEWMHTAKDRKTCKSLEQAFIGRKTVEDQPIADS